MLKTVAGLAMALLLGAVCRVVGLPVPAPPSLLGASLVVAVTLGFLLAGMLGQRP